MRVSEPCFAQHPWVSLRPQVMWYLPLVRFSSS